MDRIEEMRRNLRRANIIRDILWLDELTCDGEIREKDLAVFDTAQLRELRDEMMPSAIDRYGPSLIRFYL
jgi:hypothetical protein